MSGRREFSYYGDDERGWTIAENDMWLDGIYDTKATARAAADHSDQTLADLSSVYSIHGENRPVTMDDLRGKP